MRNIIIIFFATSFIASSCIPSGDTKQAPVHVDASPSSLQLAYLQIVREFEVAPEKVFAAFTEPDAMRVWWTEQTSFDIDLKVGGAWKIIRKEGNETYTALGEYLEVENPHRLVYSYGMPQFSKIVDTIFIDIRPVGISSSELTFTHKGEGINTELQDLPADGMSLSESGWRDGFKLMEQAWKRELSAHQEGN